MIEQKLKRLDEIVKKMESADLPLEESLKIFQEGMELVKACQKTLQEAELKVKEIVEDPSGTFKENSLNEGSDN